MSQPMICMVQLSDLHIDERSAWDSGPVLDRLARVVSRLREKVGIAYWGRMQDQVRFGSRSAGPPSLSTLDLSDVAFRPMLFTPAQEG